MKSTISFKYLNRAWGLAASYSGKHLRMIIVMIVLTGLCGFTPEPVPSGLASEYAETAQVWRLVRPETYYDPCATEVDIFSAFITAGEKETVDKIPVSTAEQTAVGEAVKREMAQKGFSGNPDQTRRMRTVFGRLMQRQGNTELTYEIHLLQSSEINAFTAGGKIFVTAGMMSFIQNDDELAGVIGHEIWHNELGHIKKHIQRAKLAQQIFGNELGNMAVVTGQILGASFNQSDEINADLRGLDLAIRAGYDGCRMINMWSRMKRMEGQRSDFDNLFSSHPYSGNRSECIKQHLSRNYNRSCN